MSRVRREANLRNLCQQLEQYAQAKGIAAAESPSAARLSRRLFLSHATASAKFSLICEDGRRLEPLVLKASARYFCFPLPGAPG